MSSLVLPDRPEEPDLETLTARLAELEAQLATRAAEASGLRATLDAFESAYRGQVGSLHEQLDRLELEIAEAELGELSKQLAEEGEHAAAPPDAPELPPVARFTSDAVRKLFRDVAKAIHPDLARDEQARDRRHALMIEANRAYASRDEERLRRILDAWHRSPDALEGDDPAFVRLRLERRIEELEEQLERFTRDLAAMKASPIHELKTMVDDAASRGRDLIAQMVRRLERDILVARNRLDAIRSTP